MGLIHVDLFTTLDGVAQAPGGPDEDPESGFDFGGWQAPISDEMIGEQIMAGMEGMDALLLGRKTYDIFAGFWPHHESGPDGEIGRLFNRIPKYVASRHAPNLEWAHSTLLGAGSGTPTGNSSDIAAAVRDVREWHNNTHVIGSLDFVQTLLAERLFDRLTLWVYPILLGSGKKVFAEGSIPTNLRLAEPATTSPKGVVTLRYELAEGTPSTGDMSVREA